MAAAGSGYFDQWYTDMAGSPGRDRFVRQALGLPTHAYSNNLLPWAAMAEVTATLALEPGHLLVDLACGRGSYGLEAARRADARLIGLDFSPVAVAVASASAVRLGQAGSAAFCLGDLAAVGVRSGAADAVLCVDAIQLADSPVAALTECARILVAGGRLMITSWEPVDAADPRLSARLSRMNLARDLVLAGLRDVVVEPRPAWQLAEQQMWEAAREIDPDGDPALESLRNEADRSLGRPDAVRRVTATAIAP